MQQGRFAGPRRTGNHHEFACVRGEIEVDEHRTSSPPRRYVLPTPWSCTTGSVVTAGTSNSDTSRLHVHGCCDRMIVARPRPQYCSGALLRSGPVRCRSDAVVLASTRSKLQCHNTATTPRCSDHDCPGDGAEEHPRLEGAVTASGPATPARHPPRGATPVVHTAALQGVQFAIFRRRAMPHVDRAPRPHLRDQRAHLRSIRRRFRPDSGEARLHDYGEPMSPKLVAIDTTTGTQIGSTIGLIPGPINYP